MIDSDSIISAFKEKLESMSEEERVSYLRGLGFVLNESTHSRLDDKKYDRSTRRYFRANIVSMREANSIVKSAVISSIAKKDMISSKKKNRNNIKNIKNIVWMKKT